MDQVLLLFQHPPWSSRALLAGTLPLRYCSARFARRVPFWTLPIPGHVAWLITAEVQVMRLRLLVGRLIGLEVLVLVRKEFD